MSKKWRKSARRSWLAVCLALSFRAFALDLTGASVVVSTNLSRQEQKAVEMLADEVEKRTGIRWPISQKPLTTTIQIVLKPGTPAEGYHIETRGNSVRVAGNDARGVLFGVGRLLREIRMEKGSVTIADGFSETSSPKYPLRGHQLGYRPKTNSYDGLAP